MPNIFDLIRRFNKYPCICGNYISPIANYCQKCGVLISHNLVDTSKQKTMNQKIVLLVSIFIGGSIFIFWFVQTLPNRSSEEQAYRIVNTNNVKCPICEEIMLKNRLALAHRRYLTENGISQWSEQIRMIPNGAHIMLYSNGNGIVATGIAIQEYKYDLLSKWEKESRIETGRWDKKDIEVQYVGLEDFRKIDPPFKKINEAIAPDGIFLPRTVIPLTPEAGEKLWNALHD